MSRQKREGHEVYLLTLTRGGATRQRHKWNYSIKEMGAVRFKEMKDVSQVYGLDNMTVLNFPDGDLKSVDPRTLENAIANEINKIKPHVVVSYAVHGVTGFHDHLVAHAVVKRVYVALRDKIPELQRLALYTINEETANKSVAFPLSHSSTEEIDCIYAVSADDIDVCRKALDCYVSFKETIEKTKMKDQLTTEVVFEFFGEGCNPPVTDVFHQLNETS